MTFLGWLRELFLRYYFKLAVSISTAPPPQVTPPTLTSDTVSARTRFLKKPEETLRISCGAVGKPKPSITWYKNGHELLENVREKHGKSVLHVRGLMVRDSGRWRRQFK